MDLWQEGCYHVRIYRNDSGYLRETWESFDNLTEARRAFRKQKARIERMDESIQDMEGLGLKVLS